MEDQLSRKNPFTGKKTRKGMYMTKERKKLLDQYHRGELDDKESLDAEELMRLYELSKMTTSIEDQVKDLERYSGRGVLDFAHKGMKFYEAKKILLIGSSGSGKSTNILNLLAESPNSFSVIHVICPQSTFDNEVYTTLRYYCKKAGITVYWSDSDNEAPLEFGDADKKDKRGSSLFLHDNTLPMFVIFDDCYRGAKGGWIAELMSNAFIFWRHRMINTIVCLQTPNYLPSPVALNYSHLFISGNFLERDIWSKVRMAPPDNLEDAIHDYDATSDKRHQFYYIKQDDSTIHKYIPYKFKDRNQIERKFKAKLPKGINEVVDLRKDKGRSSGLNVDQLEPVSQSDYEKREDAKIKTRPDTTERNLKQDLAAQKQRKYYVFNNFKYYID